MKGRWGITFAVLALLVILVPGLVLRGLSSSSAGTVLLDEPAREEHEKKHQRELAKELHGDKDGNFRPDLFRKAVADFERLKVDATRQLPAQDGKAGAQSAGPEAASGGGGVVGVQWTQIGPAPLIIDDEFNFQGVGPDAGQVPDIAIDPRNTTDRVIYAAFNDGGVWKSTDGGTTWAPKTDYMPSLSMGALELDPADPDTVYAGTGNIYNNGYFKGVGVYRSTDAGDTWSQVAGNATIMGFGIHDIKMPAANTLLVATDNGLFRSNNSGAVFTEIPVGGTTGRFITDLDLDTQNPATTVYAAVERVGVFRSIDAGLTFPAASNLFTGANGGPVGFARPAGSSFAYLSFAQSDAPDNGQTMYVNAERQGDPSTPPVRFDGMWRSTNGGANWVDISAQANAGGVLNRCQCGYDQTMGVDPVDANQVYAGYQELWYSDDGGATNFVNISDGDIHWDHHETLFSPPNHRTAGDTQTRAWIGTDGGVHYTDDAGATFVQRNGEIATNLFRAMDIGHGAGNNGYMVGGAQDTGTMHFNPLLHTGTQWHEAVNADGGRSAIDWTNPNDMYGISNGQYIRSTNAGTTWIRPGSNDIDCSPMTSGTAVDPNSGNNVYVPIAAGPAACDDGKATGLARSTDGGATFPGASVAMPGNARITYIATTPTNSQLMWVGLNNGDVAFSTDVNAAAPTFTQRNVTNAPAGLNPIGLAIDPTDTDRVVVVYPGFTGFAPPSQSRHVFMTTDSGLNWTQIGGTAGDVTQMVPDMPITSVVIDPQTDPNSIIISSDLGVLRSLDTGATWQRLGLGLPNVNVTSLSLDFTVTPSLLRAATYGRSAFELTTAEGPLLAVDCDLGFGVVAVGTSAARECSLFNVGSEDLHINGFFRASGSLEFSIASGPPTPVTIPPGEHVDYTIEYSPTNVGNDIATFQINSDDQFEPVKLIPASGTGVAGDVLVSPTSLQYNGVPVDNRTTPHEKILTTTITNQSSCPLCDLRVNSLVIGGANPSDFSLVGDPATPFTIGAGNSIEISVRFNPTLSGLRTATLTINTNDGNVVVQLSGTGLIPAVSPSPAPPATLIFPPTVIDPMCGVLCGSTLPATFTNTGDAEWIIDSVAFAGSPAFSGPAATSPPTRVQVGSSFAEQVTFRPTVTDRSVEGSVTLTDEFTSPFDLEPNIGATVNLCGEAVGRGIRVLAVDVGGNPIPSLTSLSLRANGVAEPPNVNLKNVQLTTINPPASCQVIRYHYENQNLSTTDQSAPRGSYYTLTVAVKGKKATQTFTLSANEFKVIVITVG